MTTHRWITISAVLAVAGGLAWLAKVAVIAARADAGGVDDALFFVGLALLLIASTGLGMRLAAGRNRGMVVAAVVLAPVVCLAVFVGVQIAAEPLAGLVPQHLAGEFGIVLSGLAGLVLGIWRILRTRRLSQTAAAGS
ncbi:MAG: hypothetical protein ACT4RN_11745 [Pseudonocardia sp.]